MIKWTRERKGGDGKKGETRERKEDRRRDGEGRKEEECVGR